MRPTLASHRLDQFDDRREPDQVGYLFVRPHNNREPNAAFLAGTVGQQAVWMIRVGLMNHQGGRAGWAALMPQVQPPAFLRRRPQADVELELTHDGNVALFRGGDPERTPSEVTR